MNGRLDLLLDFEGFWRASCAWAFSGPVNGLLVGFWASCSWTFSALYGLLNGMSCFGIALLQNAIAGMQARKLLKLDNRTTRWDVLPATSQTCSTRCARWGPCHAHFPLMLLSKKDKHLLETALKEVSVLSIGYFIYYCVNQLNWRFLPSLLMRPVRFSCGR